MFRVLFQNDYLGLNFKQIQPTLRNGLKSPGYTVINLKLYHLRKFWAYSTIRKFNWSFQIISKQELIRTRATARLCLFLPLPPKRLPPEKSGCFRYPDHCNTSHWFLVKTRACISGFCAWLVRKGNWFVITVLFVRFIGRLSFLVLEKTNRGAMGGS